MIHLLRTNHPTVGLTYLATLAQTQTTSPLERQAIFVASRAVEDWGRHTILEQCGTASHLVFPYFSTFFEHLFIDLGLPSKEEWLWGESLQWVLFNQCRTRHEHGPVSDIMAWQQATVYRQHIERLCLYRPNWVLQQMQSSHFREPQSVEHQAIQALHLCQQQSDRLTLPQIFEHAFQQLKRPHTNLPIYMLLYPRALPPVGLFLLSALSSHTDIHVVHFHAMMNTLHQKDVPKLDALADVERYLEAPVMPHQVESEKSTPIILGQRFVEQDDIIEHHWHKIDEVGPHLTAQPNSTLGQLQRHLLGDRLEQQANITLHNFHMCKANSFANAQDILRERLCHIFSAPSVRLSDVAIILGHPERDRLWVTNLCDTFDSFESTRRQAPRRSNVLHRQKNYPNVAYLEVDGLLNCLNPYASSPDQSYLFGMSNLPDMICESSDSEEQRQLISRFWHESHLFDFHQKDHPVEHRTLHLSRAKTRLQYFEELLFAFAAPSSTLKTRLDFGMLKPLRRLHRLATLCFQTIQEWLAEPLCSGPEFATSLQSLQETLSTCLSPESVERLRIVLTHLHSTIPPSQQKTHIQFWLHYLSNQLQTTSNPALFRKDEIVIGDLTHIVGCPFKHVICVGFEANQFPPSYTTLFGSQFDIRVQKADPNPRLAGLSDLLAQIFSTTDSFSIIGLSDAHTPFAEVFDDALNQLTSFSTEPTKPMTSTLTNTTINTELISGSTKEHDIPSATSTTNISFSRVLSFCASITQQQLRQHCAPGVLFQTTYDAYDANADQRKHRVLGELSQTLSPPNGTEYANISLTDISTHIALRSGLPNVTDDLILRTQQTARRLNRYQPYVDVPQLRETFLLCTAAFDGHHNFDAARLQMQRLTHRPVYRWLPAAWLFWASIAPEEKKSISTTEYEAITLFEMTRGDVRIFKPHPSFFEHASFIRKQLLDFYLFKEQAFVPVDLESLLSSILKLKTQKSYSFEDWVTRHDKYAFSAQHLVDQQLSSWIKQQSPQSSSPHLVQEMKQHLLSLSHLCWQHTDVSLEAE